ncbi:MAG: hypothetical protein H8D56_24385 [Planctomycetes bacterium]|nr:hypothetical protein [Planctomycetota bacterium]
MCRKLIVFVALLSIVAANATFAGMVVEVENVGGNDSVEDQLSRGMYVDSSDLELPDDGGLQVIGLRFLNVQVPIGVEITNAYVVFTVEDVSGPDAVNLIIDGELVPNAPKFTETDYDVSSRIRTEANIEWQPGAWPTANQKQHTSDISTVIQEIINQDGWSSGNAMAIIISDNPDNPSQGVRVATSGTGTTTMLHIEYGSKRAYLPAPADGAYYRDTWASVAWNKGDTAASHDVYFSENRADVEAGAEIAFLGNQATEFFVVGFPGMPYPDGLVPDTTYYWRVDEVEADGTTKHEGFVWSFKVAPKTAYEPKPAVGAELVDPNVVLSWQPGFGAIVHTVYFGDDFDDVNNAAGSLPQGTTNFTPGTLEFAKTYFWRVDEFDPPFTHKGDVWSFTTEGAVASLDPANGAVDVSQTPVLTWVPGVNGASHEVYFGSDKEAVKNADTSSPEYKGSGNLGSESYEPGQLEWDTTYYWRVDEANSANADSPWTGPLWSFTTANFLIIDDMESYNDLNEDDPASNRIFYSWIDGYDNPAANGSVVGHANPPFAEQTIVHSGNQSMPMIYDNAVGKSEATLNLTSNRDWTVKGVNKLTIWYRGASANAADTMYVMLNGSASVDNGNPAAAQASTWTEWNIDLQAFADQGVNLANVTSITLGLRSGAGGSGMLYFDDIRLYPPAQ